MWGEITLRSVGDKFSPLLVRLRDTKDNWGSMLPKTCISSPGDQLAMRAVKLGYPAAKLKTAESVTGTR